MSKEKILTSEIKKGDCVRLTHNREAVVTDNRKNSLTREVKITKGGFPDQGSTYVADWLQVRPAGQDIWYDVMLTSHQIKKYLKIQEDMKHIYYG